MKIVWAPNPLLTRIELDDVDRSLLRERLKVEDLTDRISSASFALDPKFPTPPSAGPAKSIEDRVAEAQRWLDLEYVLDDVERNGETFTQRLEQRLADYVEELLGKHDGDCVCFPCSCVKCHAETLMGINTLKGLGKHEANRFEGAFADGATIDEALQRLANYQPVWTPAWRSKAEFDKHVPRWTEEGRRAHEWLSTYRKEHFDTGAGR